VPSKLRIWANRDDGRIFQVGNEDLTWKSVTGVLALIAAILLRGLQPTIGFSSVWQYVVAGIGTALLLWSAWGALRNAV
jgi:formate hydrogenlyase subunit 3/multisubunit Na+/H+ antiporter MnhD subunit